MCGKVRNPLLSLALLLFASTLSATTPSVAALDSIDAAALQACPAGMGSGCSLLSVEREATATGLARYAFHLRVGPGEHDVIVLHRIVRETAPFVPAPTDEAVLLVHGDVWGFEAAFGDFATFLAESGVDVWGVDLRFVQVPVETTDFAFMADWGMELHVRDVGTALAVARVVRGVTGSDFGPIHLLGWSRGAQIGYAYLSAEAQRPAPLQHTAGFIPVDVYAKTNVDDLRNDACIRFRQGEARLAAGEFQDATGVLVKALGDLAQAAPQAESPIFAGLSNQTAALLTGAATFLLFPPGLEPVPVYHFTGGIFNELGLPVDLSFTPVDRWIGFLRQGAPYEPVRLLVDADRLICDEEDVSFDDGWPQVTVPVLYVGAGGGFGEFGVFTTTLLGSTDVSTHIVSWAPPEARILDFGHADLFQGARAEELVWQPILDWMRAR